jgi:hypothetical protein
MTGGIVRRSRLVRCRRMMIMLLLYVIISQSSIFIYLQLPNESIHETSVRLLYMAIKWVTNLPAFATLSHSDKVTLTRAHD